MSFDFFAAVRLSMYGRRVYLLGGLDIANEEYYYFSSPRYLVAKKGYTRKPCVGGWFENNRIVPQGTP